MNVDNQQADEPLSAWEMTEIATKVWRDEVERLNKGEAVRSVVTFRDQGALSTVADTNADVIVKPLEKQT